MTKFFRMIPITIISVCCIGCGMPYATLNEESPVTETSTDFKAVSISTDDKDMTVKEGDDVKLTGTGTITFSDGSTKDDAKIHWYDESGNPVETTKDLTPGTYELNGRISYFDNPLIAQRADPYVIYNEDDGNYYFTSSWPAYNDAEHGYDHLRA